MTDKAKANPAAWTLAKRDVVEVDRRFWAVGAQNATELKYVYSIGLIDLQTMRDIQVPNADPANRGTAAFTFPTPPKSHEVADVPATTIISTQDGGKFTEKHGVIFKDIVVTGTVGLRPNPINTSEAFKGLQRNTGITLQLPSLAQKFTTDERGLDPKEATGYDDIIFLRNLFRGYWDFANSEQYANRIVMYWINAKENDFFIVEPLGFRTTRDSSSPMSFNYNITLRTLYRIDLLFSVIRDPMSSWQKLSNAVKTVRQAVRDTARGIMQVRNAIDYVTNLPFALADLATELTFDLATNVVGEAASVLESLVRLNDINERFDASFQRKLKDWNTNIKRCEDAARILADGRANDDWRVFGGTTPTASDASAELKQKDSLIRALRLMSRHAERLMALDSLYYRPRQVVVSDYTRYYKEGGAPPFPSETPLDPHNIRLPDGAYEVRVSEGDTIRSIARRYLGDDAQWKKIAIINNLKYPYISPTAGENVIAYGGTILIPKYATEDDVTSIQQPLNTDAAMESQTPILRKYGRDLKLTNTGSSDIGLADLQVSSRGDLDTVEGVDNVYQAFQNRFSTEQGELQTHPNYGSLYPIGTKFGLTKLQEFVINTRRAVFQDPRIAEINTLKAFASGNVVKVFLKVQLRDSNIELPFDFDVRRD